MEQEILYTPEELSKMLKLSKYTIYEMIKRGDMQAHRLGRSLRISQRQLDRYLEGRGRAENCYEAVVEQQDGQQFAVTGGVRIAVATPLCGRVRIAIRPEDIILSRERFRSSARNIHLGTVRDIRAEEGYQAVLLDIGIPLTAAITRKSLEEMRLQVGDRVYAVFKTMAVQVTG